MAVVHHLHHRSGTAQGDQKSRAEPDTSQRQFKGLPGPGKAHAAHQQAGQPTRRQHHHQQEGEPEVEQPGPGQLAGEHIGQHHQYGTDDGAEEEGGSTQHGEQQVIAGAVAAEHLRGGDLEMQCCQATGNTCEKGRNHEREVAYLLRVVSDEPGALRVVAHRVEHLAQRRAGERRHQSGAHQGICGNQVVELNLRSITQTERPGADNPVGGDTAFAAKELRQHQRRRPHQFTHTQRNHGKRRGGLSSGHPTQQRSQQQSGQTTGERNQADR